LPNQERIKNYLLTVSLVELVDKELDSFDGFDFPEKVVLLSILIELKSELLTHAFWSCLSKRKNL